MNIIEKVKSKFKKEIKLSYTNEMKLQDELWKTESENLEVMKRLYNEIVREARQKGFKGYVDIYEYNGEMLATVFEKEEHYKMACDGTGYEDNEIVGHCKPLIKYLEYYLNLQ